MFHKIIYAFIFCTAWTAVHAQPAVDTSSNQLWHGIGRQVNYRPITSQFVIDRATGGFEAYNGKRRFNRALYGTNTGFRVEAGDLPEFALYMPGMGGNFKLGIVSGNQSKWLTDVTYIIATYSPGMMVYEIRDTAIIGGYPLVLYVIPMAGEEGMIVNAWLPDKTKDFRLIWAYGGATGRRFSRDGDIGADPESSFYLQPEYCTGNRFTITGNRFQLEYGAEQTRKLISGIVPSNSQMKIVDAAQQQNPLALYQSVASTTPALAGELAMSEESVYFLIHAGASKPAIATDSLSGLFSAALDAVRKVADRVEVRTPDHYINSLGGALSVAADAIWEHPSYMHGAVAWRMRLPAWRGAYAGDVLGWHDRARTHFDSYALSQVTMPDSAAVVMDTALHLARHLEKIGTGMFTSGYICRNPNGDIRPHHYDMNLVFIDQLLNHFNWTGDTAYVKKMWPLIERHLAWEKRNFDADDDGLYDAYCCIWASDALQYSGGGVTHSSAYNYRAFKTASELATLIGKDGSAYGKEADKILKAVNKELWLPDLGRYAEFKDLLGQRLVHKNPGLWTIYHALDSKLPDDFQAYQSLRYVDTEIPHIPVKAKGLEDDSLYLLSTTNWQPYTWSLNNVALAENLHTALAYWQGNRPEEAYRLWKSSLVESMYLGASPGGFQQLSFYDAIRGQLYRDFADPVGMAARTLVEGLFGIQPDALHDTLTIRPGFPASWNFASLRTPDITVAFSNYNGEDNYFVVQKFSKSLNLKLNVRAIKDNVASVLVNGKKANWRPIADAVGTPMLEITVAKAESYKIKIKWKGKRPTQLKIANPRLTLINLKGGPATLQSVYDPQDALNAENIYSGELSAVKGECQTEKTVFVKLKQGVFSWWQPLSFKDDSPHKMVRHFKLQNAGAKFDKIDLTSFFNEKVTNIFKQQYLSPRPNSPTLQLPTQGMGNWCYPLTEANIDDGGLRKLAGEKNEIILPQGIPFSTPGDSNRNNIVFTSQWDNFPDSVSIPLSGSASHAYLMMAGSTNAMQSQMANGYVYVRYKDGSRETMDLTNPQNWWPIEQDYINDGFAFSTNGYQPLRFYLKKGIASTSWNEYTTIRGYSNRAIDGGAATILDIPLRPGKELKSIVIHTIANDVVIGLMGLTLVR